MQHAKDLVRNSKKSHVLLPKHIDPSKFEELLLRDVDYFSGIKIEGISTFPVNMLKACGRLDLPKKIDQIKLSEHFHSRYPRTLCRPLLNTILELKNANFESSYAEKLQKRSEMEGSLLIKVFKEYQELLKKWNVCDSADYKNEFVNEAKTPGSRIIDAECTYIFAGFNEFSSLDLEIIDTVSRMANTYIVSPDILSLDIDYIKTLKNELISSMGFKVIEVEDKRTSGLDVQEFPSLNDEVYYAAEKISNEGGTIYAVNDVETYYSLLRYHFGENKVAISAAMRLDRTTTLNIISTLMNLNMNDWTYTDVFKILNYMPFWKQHDEVLKFIGVANDQLTLPRGHKAWISLAKEKGPAEIFDLFNDVVKKLPIKAIPLDFEKAINIFISKCPEDVQKSLEMKSVVNLIARVTEHMENKTITAQQFIRKLYNHAEEGYVEKGPINFKPLNVTQAELCSANTSNNVWFTGMNQEAFAQRPHEDAVMNDSFILAFRSEGLTYPTAKESSVIASKIIQDGVRHGRASFITNIGPAADIISHARFTKMEKSAPKVIHKVLKKELTELKLDHKYDSLSVSLIKSYMNCPYICLVERLLKVQKQEAREFGLTPIDTGNLLHSAIEVMLPKKLKNPDLEEEKELEELFNSKDFKGLNQHPLRNVFLKHYAGIIKKILDSEYKFMKEYGLEIFQTPELKFKVELGFTKGLPLTGKIDRIDLDKTNKKLYLADYKTSEIPSKTDIEKGEDIQLAVYIMAISKMYPEYIGYGAYYISIKNLDRTRMDVGSVAEAEKQFSILGSAAVEGLFSGTYTPNPMEPSLCEKCSYRRCCGAV